MSKKLIDFLQKQRLKLQKDQVKLILEMIKELNTNNFRIQLKIQKLYKK